VRVDAPEQVAPAWDGAMAARRPFVYEAITDPDVPPLPPHITIEQARAMTVALLKDPDRGHIIRQTMRDKLAEFVPGR
jgi:pyruvate dehydrogenase (quinone)